MRPRPLDQFATDQDTALWLVVAAAVCLVLGIVLRARLAERKPPKGGGPEGPGG